jgi:hypothetical protein
MGFLSSIFGCVIAATFPRRLSSRLSSGVFLFGLLLIGAFLYNLASTVWMITTSLSATLRV